MGRRLFLFTIIMKTFEIAACVRSVKSDDYVDYDFDVLAETADLADDIAQNQLFEEFGFNNWHIRTVTERQLL
jgi:hypothetical protein